MSYADTLKIKIALEIFDVAVSQPRGEEKDATREVVRELQSMHRRIIDGRAAFLLRTETKEVLARLWMRLEGGMGNKGRMQSLEQHYGVFPS
jgi:hypothetical protein